MGVGRGHPGTSGRRYVSGIEAGTEVFHGSGRLDTKAYSVDVG